MRFRVFPTPYARTSPRGTATANPSKYEAIVRKREFQSGPLHKGRYAEGHRWRMKTASIKPTYASVPRNARTIKITIPAMSAAGALAEAAPRACEAQVAGFGGRSPAPSPFGGFRVSGFVTIVSPEDSSGGSFP